MQFLGIEKQDEHKKKVQKKCTLLAIGPPHILCPKCMIWPSCYDNNLKGRLLL